MRVLLSIKPVHVANILSGAKTFEFRRKIFSRRDIKTVLIYCNPPGRPTGRRV
ncbi:putative transcriptional regulator [Bradyrhizobium sp. LM2.7]